MLLYYLECFIIFNIMNKNRDWIYLIKKNTCENKSHYVTVKNVFQRIFLAYFVIISCKLITIDYTVSGKKGCKITQKYKAHVQWWCKRRNLFDFIHSLCYQIRSKSTYWLICSWVSKILKAYCWRSLTSFYTCRMIRFNIRTNCIKCDFIR